MAQGKVVFFARVEPESQEMFIAMAPSNLRVVVADPDAGEEELAEHIQDADFLVTYRGGRVSEQVIRRARRLKLIQDMGQGTDHIPERLASELGIPVANSGGANAIAVAEHTVLLMLATYRNLLTSVDALRHGKFDTDMDRRYFHQLYKKTVGIVGFGNIGRWVAKLMRSFEANVIFYDTADIPQSTTAAFQARLVNLEELLPSADVVTLHLPLLKSTRGMIGWKQLTMMKPSAILINTSRGGLVDEAALIRALRENKIAGVGIDVFEREPPSLDNLLLRMENVVATPHIGGIVQENWVDSVKSTWENVLRVWEGEKPHNVVIFKGD